MISKPQKWVQKIPGAISEISVWKNTVLRGTKILQDPQSHRSLVEE